MRQTLATSLKLAFGAEGGYSNRKTDKGGPTKYGITASTLAAWRNVARVSNEDVRGLTLDEAAQIYSTNYWRQSGGDDLPAGLDYAAFDFGINSYPTTAVKVLQRVIGVKADGWMGAKTLAAVNAYPGGVEKLIRDYCDARMAFLRQIGGPTGWVANGRGWTIRVTGKDPRGEWKDQPGVIGNALSLAAGTHVEDGTLPSVEGAPEGGDAKAIPPAPKSWLDPGVILSSISGILGPLGVVFSGSGPVQWALAAGIVIVAAAGAYLLVTKLKAVLP